MRPVIDSVGSLYRKLEREAYRSIHARTANHKADHFFNFCVTAHSMRDFFLEDRGIASTSPRAQALHLGWNADPLLLATKEIANLSKHFQLRDRSAKALVPAKTRRVVRRRSQTADVWIDPKGTIKLIPRPIPEISLTLSDGSRYDLWAFVIDVTEYWREFLKSQGIRVRRQTVAALLDGQEPRFPK